MPLQKDFVTPSTGATAGYHAVLTVTLDASVNWTTATVSSFLSKDAKDAGKSAMYTQSIALAGLPPAGQDAFEFAESGLAEAAPADVTSFPLNRFVFAGAEIVT